MSAKAAAARAMLAAQRGLLERAIAAFASDPHQSCNLESARRMLKRVRAWQADGDIMVELAKGFMGSNGYGPLIDQLCRDAADLEARRARSDAAPYTSAPIPAASAIRTASAVLRTPSLSSNWAR